MNLKQVEVIGFKSFADLTKLTFDSGITAIVGPNGCGKSNVADAVRWVLGEQSSKTLRGTNMQDVIFKGTEKRKSLSFCEVSLLFDNSNKIFKTEFQELLITRKLFRSGESEYMINRESCRLKDIIDLLHDSGIGKSGYSIIGQGKIDEIISSKPEDRRAIFEEAAGIAKSKFKKLEAERKLERTQGNLTRITDIIAEIERQLIPLQQQSDIAKKYLDLKEQLKLQEVNTYIYQHDYASSYKEEISYKISQLVKELNEKQKELDMVIQGYNQSFDKINNIDEGIAELRDRVLFITVGLEKKAGESNLLREKIKNCETEKDRYASIISRNTTVADKSSQTLKDKAQEKKDKSEELSVLQNRLAEISTAYERINKELQSNESEAQEAQLKIYESLSKLGDVKAQISALNSETNTYTTQLAEIQESLKTSMVRLQDYSDKLKTSKDNLTRSLEKVVSCKKKLEELSVKQSAKMAELKEVEIKINTTNNNLITLKHRKKMLEDMQREYEGYFGSVKRLLTDAESNRELKSKIVGVLATLIKVPKKYETAIEMALGSAVQNIVTHTDSGAKDLVEYLKRKEYGRATFLPINSVRSRYLDGYHNQSLKIAGVLGVASELISYDKNIENIVSNLLATTVICDDLNSAIAVAKESKYSFRIVTLDGDIINPQGSITGGSKKAQITNLLSRESNINEAQKMVDKLESENVSLRRLQEELVFTVNKLTTGIKSETELLREAEIGYATENERCDKLTQIVADLESEVNTLESNKAKVKQILNSIQVEQEKIAILQENYAVESNISIENTEFVSLKQKREEYSEALTELKVQIVQIETFLHNVDMELFRLEEEISTAQTVLAETQQHYDNNENILKALKEIDLGKSDDSAGTEIEELNEAKAKLASLDEYKHQLQVNLRKLEEDRMALGAVVNRLQDKKYQEELNLTKVDTDIETMQERIWSEYELTYSSAQDYKVENFNIKTGLTSINKLKKEILSLGNVNVNAIEDCKALQDRFGNMYEQSQDLIKAEADLKKIIKDLANEMVSRFEAEFNKINENFGKVFKELFGGGTAKLQLLKSDDVLEAGVDIIAEPPGKKLSNITLLSGGEKALTAIAILFAILRLKPMPFCLLDEIEAPLDEANVGRFAKYLQRYSHETQFVVITHKKTTMEHADTLYGVTMEEKGVSKIVSVKLSDAIKNSEEK